MSKPHSGGGRTTIEKTTRTGAPSHGVSPKYVSQIGTAREPEGVERMRDRSPQGANIKLGNQVALNVGSGGPGKGRTVHASGSQGHHTEAPRQPQRAEVERGDRRIPEPRRPTVSPGPKDILRSYGGEVGRGRS
jgi:hypothetical protein